MPFQMQKTWVLQSIRWSWPLLFLFTFQFKKVFQNSSIFFSIIIQVHKAMEADPEIQPEQSQTQPKKVQSKQPQTDKTQANFNKKKELVTNLIHAKKQNDRKKVKLYEGLLKKRKFWGDQPVIKADIDQDDIFGNIQGKRTVQEVRKQPLELPSKDMNWCIIDIKNEKQLDQLYHLLTNHYVEDDDNTFRFDYSRQFLKWALTPPGYQENWIVGIRDQKGQLKASITGVPVLAVIQGQKIKMAEINFLCVHRVYRVKGLTPLLIAQVTRRVNLRDKWQAIYTSGTVLPTPFTQSTYWHRSLNPKKLIDIRFSSLGPKQTNAMVQKLYKLPEQPTIEGIRPMVRKDVEGVTKLINQGLNKYVVKFHYTEQQVKHYFMPRDKIVYTYVKCRTEIIDGKKKSIVTDMLSFYSLPSHVMKNPKHNMLYACYSFFNFATSVPFDQLINNALILAKNVGYDVYNCLDLMENDSYFKELHFQIGDGCLNYYLYNWAMKERYIKPNQLGVVLF